MRTVTIILRVLNIANAALLGLACFYAFQMISGECQTLRAVPLPSLCARALAPSAVLSASYLGAPDL